MTENAFLEARIGQAVAVYLINGIKLVGILKDHDSEVVFLRPQDSRDGGTQMMVCKAAIASIVSTLFANGEQDRSDPLKGILSQPARASTD